MNLCGSKIILINFLDQETLTKSLEVTEMKILEQNPEISENQLDQIMDALHQIEGAYCLVMLTDDALIAVRDPNGFRPLALGKVDGKFCVASETCAFDIINAEYIRDVEPGEVIIIDREAVKDDEPKSFKIAPKSGTDTSQCIFEYVYF